MNKKLYLLLAALLASALNTAAYAIPVLSFSPSTQSTTIGGSVSVDVLVSGLEDGGINQIVSAYDLSVNYDASILSLSVASFFGLTGFNFTAPTVGNFTVSFGTGQFDFANTSALLDSALQGIQGNSLVLTTLTFSTLATGTSALTFLYDDLTGLDALALNHNTNTGSVTVTGNGTVPEPSTLFLFGIGAVGLLRFGGKKAGISIP